MTSVNEVPRIDLTSGDALAVTVLDADGDGPLVYVSAFDADHDTVAALELSAEEAAAAGDLLHQAADEARRGTAG
jgi:hypothetical protein